MTEPIDPPEPIEPPPAAEEDTGGFADMFHTAELSGLLPRRSHRAPTPLLGRLLAPFTAVAVVIVVIVLLIVINGHNPHVSSPAASNLPTIHPPVTHTSAPVSKPHPVPSTAPSTAPSTKPSTQPSKRPVATKPTATAPHPKPSKKPKAAVPTAMAPVQVLNNSRIHGLAASVAHQVSAKGWHVSAVGNLQGVTPVVTLYYASGDSAAAKHLAHDFPKIARVRPDAAGGIHSRGLTLVLTSAWAG